jgi:membrane-associated phospholipid phosphatase
MTLAFKYGVGRERPDGANTHSFVSGHSSQSFAMATVIAHHYPKARIPAYAVASFVAVSRLVQNKHWVSDTVAGAAVGVIVARTVVREDGLLKVGKVSFSPQIPRGGGIALSASF